MNKETQKLLKTHSSRVLLLADQSQNTELALQYSVKYFKPNSTVNIRNTATGSTFQCWDCPSHLHGAANSIPNVVLGCACSLGDACLQRLNAPFAPPTPRCWQQS